MGRGQWNALNLFRAGMSGVKSSTFHFHTLDKEMVFCSSFRCSQSPCRATDLSISQRQGAGELPKQVQAGAPGV